MKRIEYIDRARVLGMFFVYYAHFVEKLFREGGVTPALDHWKFVCSFLMQFFFFLAGVFWRPAPLSSELFFKKLKTRIIPTIFFSLVLIPLWINSGVRKFFKLVLEGGFLRGTPLNSVLWFLVCMMSVELLAALIVRYLKVDPLRLFVYAFLAFCFGYYVLVVHGAQIARITGINPGIWFIDDAFIVIPFYIFGYLCRDALVKINDINGWRLSVIAAPIAGFLLWNTYSLNSKDGGVVLVLINASIYGNIWYFLLTSLIGIVFLLAFSRLISVDFAFIRFIGQNSLIFLALNGISFHFMDAWVVNHVGWLPVTSLDVFLFTSAYVVIVLILFSPLAFGARRWFPELSGFEWSSTSLLPPMREWKRARFWVPVQSFMQKYLILSESEEGNNRGRSLS